MVILAATGIVAGWLAGLVTRGSGFGLIGNMLAAIAGAFVLFYIGSDLAYYLGGFGVALLGLWGAFLALWLIGRIRR
jgi:uncharacterized membrane protein YeaQ/YmgE (transglycosylase-associated protein family)